MLIDRLALAKTHLIYYVGEEVLDSFIKEIGGGEDGSSQGS